MKNNYNNKKLVLLFLQRDRDMNDAASSVSEHFRVYMSLQPRVPHGFYHEEGSRQRKVQLRCHTSADTLRCGSCLFLQLDGCGGYLPSGPCSFNTLTSGLLCHFSSRDHPPHVRASKRTKQTYSSIYDPCIFYYLHSLHYLFV